jgi:hypothetical protein
VAGWGEVRESAILIGCQNPVDSFAFLRSRPGTDRFDHFVLCWATSATAVPVARHGPVLLRAPAPRAGPCFSFRAQRGIVIRLDLVAALPAKPDNPHFRDYPPNRTCSDRWDDRCGPQPSKRIW